MNKKFYPALVFLLACSGCATTTKETIVIKTELDNLYDSDFKNIVVPESSRIKELATDNAGSTKDFPHVAFDEVWDSAMVLLLQEGIIIRSEKEKGMLLAITKPPVAIFVENGEPVKVYRTPLMNFYEKALDGCETPSYNEFSYATPDSDLIRKNEFFFDKLSTQVYSGKKWKYLFD